MQSSTMMQKGRAGPRLARGAHATRVQRTSQRCVAVSAGKAAQRVQLGDSDLMVSQACLGTMTWGQQNTEAEAHEQMSYSWEQGINFMDTAEMYPVPTKAETQGKTDEYIGTWMKNQKRDQIILASKVSGYGGERLSYVRSPPRDVRVTRDQVVESVDASLKRLQTDYIDLLQIHWPDRYVSLFGAGAYDIAQQRPDDVPFEEQLLGLQDVIQAGKVRYVGVSNETSYGVSEFCHLAKTAGLPKIQTIQNSYSLLVRTGYETDLAETCSRHNVSLLAYSPLAGGSLTNKYNDGTAGDGARLNLFPGYMERYKSSMVKLATAEYAEIAGKYGLTPTQLAMSWCQDRWFVACSIFGATTMQNLKDNIAAFDAVIPGEAHDDIMAVFKKYKDPTIMN